MKRFRWSLFLAAMALAAGPALAEKGAENKVTPAPTADPGAAKMKVSAVFEPAQVAPEEMVTLKVTFDLAKGFQTYPTKQADPSAGDFTSTIKVEGPPGLDPSGDFKDPPGTQEDFPGLDAAHPERKVPVTVLEGKKVIERRYTVFAKTSAGEHRVKITIETQVSDQQGIEPFQQELAVPLTVTGATGSAPAAAAPPAKKAEDDGAVAFVLSGAFWGFISLLTPCVFPMIPITVSFFLKQSEKKQHNALAMASVYSGTIVGVLTISAMLLLGFFQELSQRWETQLFIGGLFMVFALSLFGLFEIRLPTFLSNYTSAREGEGGMVGTVFMALTFTLISFTCVAPFLGGFAGVAAQGRTYLELLLGALAFSITFASPFFFLALFPSMLKTLPRSGAWMNSVKVVMAFFEVAAGLKFIRGAELIFSGGAWFFTYDLVMGAYVAICLLCGLYLLNLFKMPHDEGAEASVGVLRLMIALVFLSLGLHLLPGIFKQANGANQQPRGVVFAWIDSFLLPDEAPPAAGLAPGGPGGEAKAGEEFAWSPDLQAGLERAWANRQKKTPDHQLVFIDFTGMICTNCRINERNVFPNKDVREAMRKYELVQLYTDRLPSYLKSPTTAEENKAFQKKTFGDLKLPMYVILEPQGGGKFREVARYDEGKINDVAAFIEFLRKPLQTSQVAGR